MPSQFKIGDEVFLFNPRAVKQKVAKGRVSGLPGEQKFHFKGIPEAWLKVNVTEIKTKGVPLMYPAVDPDQEFIEHMLGTCVLWHSKNVKISS